MKAVKEEGPGDGKTVAALDMDECKVQMTQMKGDLCANRVRVAEGHIVKQDDHRSDQETEYKNGTF